jgi:hypothetical protein
MRLVCHGVGVHYRVCHSEVIGYWSGPKYPRWVRTLSHPDAATCIMVSTSVLARSFTTRGSRTVRAADRWKKLLSRISRADSASG